MPEMKCKISFVKTMDSKEVTSARHKRSKSDSDKRVQKDKLDSSLKSFQRLMLDIDTKGQTDIKSRPSPDNEVQSSLKQEIQQLEKWLQDQLVMRRALEKALGYKCPVVDLSSDSLMPKPTKELIREIAMLELEVMYLEQYLLSQYRKAFEQQISSLSPTAVKDRKGQPLGSQSRLLSDATTLNIPSRKENPAFQSGRMMLPYTSATKSMNEACVVHSLEKHSRGIRRSHSSLLQRAVCSARVSPSSKNLTRALEACHTLPLSFLEHGQNANSGGVISLADHLGTRIADHIPETPNRISEDMVRCMGAIYCRLADSPLVPQGLLSSPTSSFSSKSTFSPNFMGYVSSPGCKRESTLDALLDNRFVVDGLKEFSGSYTAMLEVTSIRKKSQRLNDVNGMLHDYKLLVHRLETVDPRKMKSEEKLAFWINVHNAMMMHAHLEYGIPKNNMKRTSLLVKAKYNIGGRTINADMIRGSILGCRTHPPGQWLRILLSPKMKFKDGDEWQAYAIEHPEPLLHFALCSGSHSDPPVRIYTPKRLFQQLGVAKEQYVQVTVGTRKEQTILLPKVIDTFAKDSNLSEQVLLDMIQCYLPETIRTVVHRWQQKSSYRIIEWVPHNCSFRYLLSRELTSL
ncbi:uncharacterized protein [Elaeis guineensis]|uniref:Uncharacterized protein LOC105033707 isoform X2 n=1 Tax=Elaeis guineensis var. tenera TaxID=51953 RepID=A0A6J0PC09_ELAGV|nr:uncharacterized protein LOC105033707 isoform X2 [Elaeis guineensis]